MIYLFYERGMKSNLRPVYECLWGEKADAEGLFNVAELSKAKTYRENICRSTGRDSADRAPLGSGEAFAPAPSAFRLRLKYSDCVFVHQTWGEGETVDLHMKAETEGFTGPLQLSTESHGAVRLPVEGADGPTSFFPTGFISALPPASSQIPSLPSVVSILKPYMLFSQ